jgi:hypothetical protein
MSKKGKDADAVPGFEDASKPTSSLCINKGQDCGFALADKLIAKTKRRLPIQLRVDILFPAGVGKE